MKGLGAGIQRLQHNIVDLFPGIPPYPDRWSLHGGHTHENIILMGDFNIDFKTKGAGFDKLSKMYDIFNLTNLIKSETSYTKNHKSLNEKFMI